MKLEWLVRHHERIDRVAKWLIVGPLLHAALKTAVAQADGNSEATHYRDCDVALGFKVTEGPSTLTGLPVLTVERCCAQTVFAENYYHERTPERLANESQASIG